MIGWRLAYAAAFLIPILLLLFVDFHFSGNAPGIWLLPLALAATALGAAELADLLRASPLRPSARAAWCGAAFIVLAGAAPLAWPLSGAVYPADCPLGRLGWPLGATALAVTVTLVLEAARFESPGKHLARVAGTVFVLVYLGLFLSFLFPLRSFHGNAWGMVAVTSMLTITKFSDAGAYATGKLLGRHKLVPRLSPGKTIEGAVGGLLTAVAVSWIFFTWLTPLLVEESVETAAWRSMTYGAVLGLAALVGDLSESLIKRDMERKDSSRWLKGLGGILDLLDSVIVAAPTAYLCWSLGIVGPHG